MASGFPNALVVRLPALPAEAGRPRIVVTARGRSAAPALRSFGLASRGDFSQRGAVTETRFARPRAPVWLAFEPDDSACSRRGGGGGRADRLGRGSAPRERLLRVERARLGGEGAVAFRSRAVFTTPPSSGRAGAMLPLPGEVVARLLSLGYLPFASSTGALPAAARGRGPGRHAGSGRDPDRPCGLASPRPARASCF